MLSIKDYKHKTWAEKYSNFIINELLPFIKKQSRVRKFNSITLAGYGLGGLSAFDVAWDHADKIDKVGVFSGSLGISDKNTNDPSYSDDKSRILINKIRSSRKRPHLKYWFYAGGNEETTDRAKDGIINVVNNTRDLIDLIKKKNVCPPEDIIYTEIKEDKGNYDSWRKVFPEFIIWAVAK